MFGLFLALVYMLGSWLLGNALPAATLTALEFLLRWYVLWSVIGGLYGLITIVIATRRAEGGCLGILFMFLFSSPLITFIWVIHYGALNWGVNLLIGLFTAGFSPLALFGGVALITVGCLMQVVELIIISTSK